MQVVYQMGYMPLRKQFGHVFCFVLCCCWTTLNWQITFQWNINQCICIDDAFCMAILEIATNVILHPNLLVHGCAAGCNIGLYFLLGNRDASCTWSFPLCPSWLTRTQTPTIFAGICLDLCGVIYLIAFLRKEKRLTVDELRQADDALWQKM